MFLILFCLSSCIEDFLLNYPESVSCACVFVCFSGAMRRGLLGYPTRLWYLRPPWLPARPVRLERHLASVVALHRSLTFFSPLLFATCLCAWLAPHCFHMHHELASPDHTHSLVSMLPLRMHLCVHAYVRVPSHFRMHPPKLHARVSRGRDQPDGPGLQRDGGLQPWL